MDDVKKVNRMIIILMLMKFNERNKPSSSLKHFCFQTYENNLE